ncbi:MAG: hypothetical protein HRT61_18425 [Ekhidna sp.]|nr:hypothetical protein [Ekhidna sp.]
MGQFSAWFEKAEHLWHERATTSLLSRLLILGFMVGLGLAVLSYFGILKSQISFFISIDISFSILLVFEVFGLIFVLPKSVADSLGKQFEIFSIILLRAAFKEFGAFQGIVEWDDLGNPAFYHMFSDAFGALIIFAIIGFYYRAQRHERITDTDREQKNFVVFKQILAVGIFIVFVTLGVYDLWQIAITKSYQPSIPTFYLFLIFTDILILLYSMRYTSRYFNIFRYSSFAFATVLIRMALSAGPIVNVIMGVVSGLFVLALSYTYNFFIEKSNE